jgi:hypothetical protein
MFAKCHPMPKKLFAVVFHQSHRTTND